MHFTVTFTVPYCGTPRNPRRCWHHLVLSLFQGHHQVFVFRASLTPLVLARHSRARAAFGPHLVLSLFQGHHQVFVFRASLTPLVLARHSRARAAFGPHLLERERDATERLELGGHDALVVVRYGRPSGGNRSRARVRPSSRRAGPRRTAAPPL